VACHLRFWLVFCAALAVRSFYPRRKENLDLFLFIFDGRGKTWAFIGENALKIFESGTTGEVENGIFGAQERAVTSQRLKAATKAAMRHAWRSQAKSGTKLRPDTYLGRNCRRLQSI
jgi:hypothetical protein